MLGSEFVVAYIIQVLLDELITSHSDFQGLFLSQSHCSTAATTTASAEGFSYILCLDIYFSHSFKPFKWIGNQNSQIFSLSFCLISFPPKGNKSAPNSNKKQCFIKAEHHSTRGRKDRLLFFFLGLETLLASNYMKKITTTEWKIPKTFFVLF